MPFYSKQNEPDPQRLHAPSAAMEIDICSVNLSAGSKRFFTDSVYLSRVVAHLKQARQLQGLDVQYVAKRAGIRQFVIARAEELGITPPVSQFKAWSKALGLSWNRVWADSLPGTGNPLSN
jgi:ribosome-binding protein aMBF1 (putative translation factor)